MTTEPLPQPTIPGTRALAQLDERRPPLRYRTLVLAAAGVIVFACLLGAGTAWGVASAVDGSRHASALAASASAARHSGIVSGHATTNKAEARRETRGLLTAVGGETWSLTTDQGATLTLTLESSTVFGSRAKPATEASFVAGDRVIVIGHRDGDTVTVKRIVHAHSGTNTRA